MKPRLSVRLARYENEYDGEKLIYLMAETDCFRDISNHVDDEISVCTFPVIKSIMKDVDQQWLASSIRRGFICSVEPAWCFNHCSTCKAGSAPLCTSENEIPEMLGPTSSLEFRLCRNGYVLLHSSRLGSQEFYV